MLKISSCFTCNSVALIKRAENTGNCPKDVHSYGNKGLLEGGRKSRELKGWKKMSYHSRVQKHNLKGWSLSYEKPFSWHFAWVSEFRRKTATRHQWCSSVRTCFRQRVVSLVCLTEALLTALGTISCPTRFCSRSKTVSHLHVHLGSILRVLQHGSSQSA